MDGFLFELHSCVSTPAAIMTYEELTEFLDRDYHSITPCHWQGFLLEHDLLMPRGSNSIRYFAAPASTTKMK
ncbi:MAG: hypothetical protein IKB04_00480 [Clostridia bacterium]|nr:hypothetical protein [Clostridia bacterium]